MEREAGAKLGLVATPEVESGAIALVVALVEGRDGILEAPVVAAPAVNDGEEIELKLGAAVGGGKDMGRWVDENPPPCTLDADMTSACTACNCRILDRT